LGYIDWPTELIQQGQTQLWKVTHNGVDSHWIHFHLFNVQVINRVGWDGSNRPPDPNEVGWKETVRMNPLEDVLVALQPITPTLPFPLPDSIRPNDVTKPVGVADPDAITGLDPNSGNATLSRVNQLVNFGWEYVWHCHILGHEENDMMRPIIYMVPPPAPTNLTVTMSGAKNRALRWQDNSASETSFTVQRSTTTNFLPADAGFAQFLLTNATSAPGFNTKGYGQTVSMTDTTTVTGTTYYYRVRADDSFQPLNVASPTVPNFVQTPMSSAWNTQLVTAQPSTMTSPVAGSTLTSNLVTFTWTVGVGVTANEIWVGTSAGASNVTTVTGLAAGTLTAVADISGVTANSTVYVRLRSMVGGSWVWNDYTYKAPAFAKAIMLTPAPGSALAGNPTTFTWDKGIGSSAYQIWVGATVGSGSLFNVNTGTATTANVTLPIQTVPGSTLYVRLYSKNGANWVYNDYTYTAPAAAKATMLTPAPASLLPASPVTFTYNPGFGASQFSLWVGTAVGKSDLALSPNATYPTTSITVSIKPTLSTTVYVRLFSLIGTTWSYNDYTYSFTPNATKATMLTPAPGATLGANPVTMTWNAGAGATSYTVWFGSTAGASNLGISATTTSTSVSTTVGGTSGSTVYVRLWTLIGTTYLYNDYTYIR
jgi:hypothetical protein